MLCVIHTITIQLQPIIQRIMDIDELCVHILFACITCVLTYVLQRYNIFSSHESIYKYSYIACGYCYALCVVSIRKSHIHLNTWFNYLLGRKPNNLNPHDSFDLDLYGLSDVSDVSDSETKYEFHKPYVSDDSDDDWFANGGSF